MYAMKRVRFKPMDFSETDISDAPRKGRMPVLMAETIARCSLNCVNCYRKEPRGGWAQKSKELSLEERLALIRDAAGLGTTAYHIVGAGETLDDPDFPMQLEEARRFGMEVMVPTNGIGLQSERTVDMLDASGASILLKLNSFSDDVERRLVGQKGYADMRNRVLEKLLERNSFNREEIGGSGAVTTRLAISCMITRLNQHEVLDILRFCREHNIAPFIDTFIPVGRTAREIGLTPAQEEIEGLFLQAKERDTRMGIDGGNGNIYLGGMECFQRGLGPYVNIIGEARVCVGEKEAIGNIREESLAAIWTRIREMTADYVSNCGRLRCPPRENARMERETEGKGKHCKDLVVLS
jgi:MoaA/NifB/PqqE/SkfB family radical SAM enzyme